MASATVFPNRCRCPKEIHMARKLMKIGGWYIAYEVTSTLVILALVAWGFNLPGL
jgi:hypothetical protein